MGRRKKVDTDFFFNINRKAILGRIEELEKPENGPNFYLGVDPAGKDSKAYCLTRRLEGFTEIIFAKVKSVSEVQADFNQEVENLAKYFNAKIIKETG